MTDTIELLAEIGRNASLRYASADELAAALAQAGASKALKDAVISGDSSGLNQELGRNPMIVQQSPQSPGHEEDPPDQDDDAPDAVPQPGTRSPEL